MGLSQPPQAVRTKTDENAGVSPSSSSSLTLLHLPPEILLMIARLLVRQLPQEYYSTSLHHSEDFNPVLCFSSAHSHLRWICMALRSFRQVCPRSDEAFRLDDNESLSPALFRIGLSSLGINIGESSLWKTCGKIMKHFPGLDELSLAGFVDTRMVAKFCQSELGTAFTQFEGSSLILKNFKNSNMLILQRLNRQRITKLHLDQCELHTLWDGRRREVVEPPCELPLCPNARVISYNYVGTPNSDGERNLASPVAFIHLFLDHVTDLQHFEVSYGFQPKLFRHRKHFGTRRIRAFAELDHNANWAYETSRRMILETLTKYSTSSLLSYTEHNDLRGPFMEDRSWWSRHGRELLYHQRFENMRLLAFRCQDLSLLTAFDGIDDCTAGYRHVKTRWKTLAERKQNQNHSIWQHVRAPVKFFYDTDKRRFQFYTRIFTDATASSLKF
jgi:hypothetical protein